MQKHSMLYELTHPISGWLVELKNKVTDAVIKYQNERMKRVVLHRQLEGLTDPTFLDRALAGEESKDV